MPEDSKGLLLRLGRAVQFIAFVLWVGAGVGVPVALLVGDYGGALLVLVGVLFWQFLSSLLSALLPMESPGARCRFHYRVTAWGLVYCAVAVTFCVVSLHWGMNLIYLTAAFLLGGAVCAAVFPALVLKQTSAGWDLPEHVFAGDMFSVEFTLRNQKSGWGGLSAFGLRVGADGRDGSARAARHSIRRLAPGHEHSLVVRQYLPERGIHRLPPLSVSTRFPFGLVEASAEMQPEQEVLVLPRLGHIRQDVLLRYKGGEARWLLNLPLKDQQGEFRSLREYQQGDNPRHIHWATSARFRKLYVREFEQRQMHSVLILLDSHAPAEGSAEAQARRERFETAVSFTATLAALLSERNVFYAFASYCPDLRPLPYDVGYGHFYSLLETLALATTTSEHTFADLVEALSFHEVGGGGICLVTPGPLSAAQRSAALGRLAKGSVSIDVSQPEFHEIFTP